MIQVKSIYNFQLKIKIQFPRTLQFLIQYMKLLTIVLDVQKTYFYKILKTPLKNLIGSNNIDNFFITQIIFNSTC